MKNLKKLGLIGLTSTALLLSGCFSSSDKDEKVNLDGLAVVQSVDKSGMIEFTNGIDRVVSRYNETTGNDYSVFTSGNFYYHLGKYDIDTIQKYHIDNPTQGYYPNDGFSLRSAGDVDSANPYNMAFLNDSQAIITRYGASTAWVVNLNAQNISDFFKHELDLTNHATGEGDSIPEMDMVFLHDGKAFITLQNLTNWMSTGNERIVVFDTITWKEIDTNPDQKGIQHIKLQLSNHQAGTKVGNKLYLGSLVYGVTNTGGIEVVNLDDYSVEVITKDIGVNILTSTSSGKVFFTSYDDWMVNTLYKLNSGNTYSYSKVSEELEGKNMSALNAVNEELWLGYSDNGHYIVRLDADKDYSEPRTLADIKLSQVEMALKPIKIAFFDKK